MVDASEHQDSNSRKDDEDDDGRHDDNNECGHAVVWQFISCGGENRFARHEYSPDYSDSHLENTTQRQSD